MIIFNCICMQIQNVLFWFELKWGAIFLPFKLKSYSLSLKSSPATPMLSFGYA